MTERTKKGDYEIGYGRTPKHTRFKPGESGFPSGRPKGSRNRLTLLAAELKAQVVVNENGKRKKISKAEVIIRQLVNKAASGDQRATTLLLTYWGAIDAKAEEAGAARPTLSEAERIFLKSLEDRMNAKGDEDNE